MNKVLNIARGSERGTQRRQCILYELADERDTVASALRALNARADAGELYDTQGQRAESIRWECSCLQKKCGACAMVINGVPRLACDTRLVELTGDEVRLDPLQKFELVEDLLVDRAPLFERLRDLGAWFEREVELPTKRSETAYDASRCLQCGLCLEVCPNFSVQNEFGGMAAMAPLARLLAEAPAAERKRLASSYKSGVFGGCGKSLACRNVCPAGINIDALMARSNAAALWHRW